MISAAGAALQFFSEARWLNGKRIAAYSGMILALTAAGIVAGIVMSPHFIDPLGRPLGTDFIGFWAAGHMALDGHAVQAWSPEPHLAAERLALPWKAGQQVPILPWFYPPTFLMAMAGLALLPYGPALILWLTLTIPIYIAALRRILPGKHTLLAGLAFPAVVSNLAHGQTGFLATGLFGLAFATLDESPQLAGVFIGLLAFKPQLGVLIPLALLAGRRWATLISAALTVAAAAGISSLLWGAQSWLAFRDGLVLARVEGLEKGGIDFAKLQSIFAAVRLVGGSLNAAWVAQGIFLVAGAVAVIWVWRSSASAPVRNATLCIASLMTSPYLFDYDLLLLALPIAWLASEGLRTGFLPWEKVSLLCAWLLPPFCRSAALALHLPLAVPVILLLLGLTLRRATRSASDQTWDTEGSFAASHAASPPAISAKPVIP